MLVILAGGSLAFFMIMSEFFLIKRTSVLTLSVCGIFKEVATIFISSLIFGDVLTIINIVGLCITLFGIGLYNWLKFRVMRAKVRKETAATGLEDELSSQRVAFHEQPEDSEDYDMDDINTAHIYSTVAESTPILLVDGGLTTYRDDNSIEMKRSKTRSHDDSNNNNDDDQESNFSEDSDLMPRCDRGDRYQ